MKRTLINIAILSTILGTGMAQAGGFDRSGQDTSIILKEGNLLEITSVSVSPKVTGTYSEAQSGGVIKDVAPDYNFTNLAFRTEISDDMALAIIQDQPYGAGVNWTDGVTHNPAAGEKAVSYNGVKAEINTSAVTALVSYDMADDVTLYGGIKNQSISATASNPVVGGYSISTNTDSSVGYVLGAAIEKPEIAMRVAFTYHSKVGHDLSIIEKYAVPTPVPSTLSFDSPEAYNLDFQTGIAANTLLFGTIRHVKWKQFSLKPGLYNSLTTPDGTTVAPNSGKALKEFTNNPTTYSIGLGRKFTDQWSGAVTYGTEAAEGTAGGPLGPTDGFTKMGLGVTYTGDKASVTVGVQKVNLGGTTIPKTYTATDGSKYISSVNLSGNTGLVTAVKVAYKF